MDMGRKTVLVTLVGNLALAAAKAWIGLAAGSVALLAEAMHSGADVAASSGVLLGLTIARMPPDNSHPYGHGKVESLTAMAIALTLVYVGITMGLSSLRLFFDPAEAPSVLALWGAVLAIGAKEIMYRYTARAAKKTDSVALMADAWHHRADAVISVAVLLGVAGSRLGLPAADPLAGLVMSLLIIRVGLQVLLKATNQLTDACPGPEKIRQLTDLVGSVPHVRRVKSVKARSYGSSLYLDVNIGIDQDLNVKEGHSIATMVKECLRSHLPEVSEVLIHVSPFEE